MEEVPDSGIIYSSVARGTTVLAEFAVFSGNFNAVALQCLVKLPAGRNNRLTYVCDHHTFNFLVADGFTYLAVADEECGRQVRFLFLERVKEDFILFLTQEKGKPLLQARGKTNGAPPVTARGDRPNRPLRHSTPKARPHKHPLRLVLFPSAEDAIATPHFLELLSNFLVLRRGILRLSQRSLGSVKEDFNHRY